MGKVIKKKFNGMSWWMKTSLVLLLTLATTVSMYQGWYTPKQSNAAITTINSWTEIYTSTNTFPGTLAYPVAAGSGTNRLLVVAVSSAIDIASAQTCSVTYGGQPMTLATSDAGATQSHTYLLYLKETGLDAATSTNLVFTFSDTASVQHVYASVYDGVDQTTSIAGISSGTGTTSIAIPSLTIASGDQAVEVVNMSRTGGTTYRTLTTPAANWTAVISSANSNDGTVYNSADLLTDSTAGSTTANHTISSATASIYAMSAMSIKAYVPPAGDTLTASANTAIATSPQLTTAANVLMQRFQLAANANTIEMNSLTINDLGTATLIDNVKVYEDTVSQATLPGTATLIGNQAAWNGAATTITLNQGLTSDRTVTAGTPKFIYIVFDMNSGMGTKTVQSSVTAVGVVAPDTGATGLAYNSTAITLSAVLTDTLTVGTNTPIAVAASDSAVGVVMQRVKLDSNANSADKQVILSSVTLDDNAATATSFANVKIYIDATATATLPGTAVMIGSQASFTGGSTIINLTGGTAADRTVTNPTSKYLYIVYDMASGQATKTVQSRITAVSVSAPDTGVTGLALASNSFTLTSAPISQITSCDGCHGYSAPIGTFTDAPTTRNTPPGTFKGSHNAHVIGEAIVCSTCHVAPASELPADFGHSKGSINMQASINGGTYSKASPITVINNPAFGSCNGTSCHAQVYAATAGTSPNWGTAGGGCGACHNAGGAFQGNGAPNTGGHNIHMAASAVCGNCHTGASGTSGGANHGNGVINVADGYNGGAPEGTATKRAAGGTYYTCTTASCHASPYGPGYVTTQTWRATSGGCIACHAGVGAFIAYSTPTTPNIAVPQQNGPNTGSHSAHLNYGRYVCQECHDGAVTGTTGGLAHGNGVVNVTGGQGGGYAAGVAKHAANSGYLTCTTACHIATVPTWGQLTLKCIDCHSTTIIRTKGRPGTLLADAVAEFGLAWGHKKSGRALVADDDCIVCHLEGNGVTHKTSKYHADGNIDLRDPDGAGETPITNISGAAFTFQRFSTSYAATARTATGHTVNNIDNVVTMKFCMKCHDAGGATNPTARSNNGGTGTNAMPFGGIALGATYTALNKAIGTQGLIDVSTQFLSTNSSRHPVGAPNSRAYPASTRLAAPYNNIGTTRDANTAASNTASPRVKANSVVLYCNDCHTTSTALTLRTITAHGNAVTLRGTVFVASPTLCTSCHAVAGQTTTNGYLTSSQHGAGSGITSGNSNIGTSFRTCHNCHFSSQTAPARPVRAFDVHGFNGMLATGNAWAYGNANGMRPIAFMRNVAWSSTSPRPYVATVAGPGQFNLAAGASNCGGSSSLGNCGSENHNSYSPGGSY